MRHCGKGRNAGDGCFGRAKAICMGKVSRCIVTKGDVAGQGAGEGGSCVAATVTPGKSRLDCTR